MAAKRDTVPTSRSTGTSAHSRQRASALRAAIEADSIRRLAGPSNDLEEAHPAELGELGLVGVEHEHAGVREVDLDDAPLSLSERDGVRELEPVAGAGRVVAEEIAVQVERVDEIELGQVGEVDADRLLAPHRDRVLR